MLIEALRLRDFRNLRSVYIEPHRRFNVFAGQNGQGKTNLLEAIYLLSAAKSFRGQTTNKKLVHFEGDQALLEARICRGGHVRRVGMEISEGGKKISLNDQSIRNLSDFFGTLNVVMFGPEDLAILKGSPSRRRQFVDRAIFNAHPAFATESMHYEDVLKNRNALLKEQSFDASLLAVYDDQFVEWGVKILRRRVDFLEHFRPFLGHAFRQIFGADLEPDLRYDATWIGGSIEVDRALEDSGYLEQLLFQSLQSSADEERERGYTLVGPHRDDLRATLDGREVRSYASQGQTRAFVLAMKIAEVNYLKQRYHFAPVLLLDDVSSELDRERTAKLFEFLRDRPEGQVFITTTHRDHIPLGEEIAWFSVSRGAVEPQ